jgi:PAS domain S-box-containing protein
MCSSSWRAVPTRRAASRSGRLKDEMSAEERWRAMVERSSDAVLLVKPADGGILYANPAFEGVTGYTGEELRGREVAELLNPDYRDAQLAYRLQLLRSPDKVITHETVVLRKDGSSRWVENTITNLLHDPGVGAVVMNFRDITERKLADAERVRLEQRLRTAEKMEAVGRLAGGIAHDFNNILGGILGYSEMLVEGTEQGSALRRYAENVFTAAQRGSDLVEQILSYSRNQCGKRIPVALDRIVVESLEATRGTLAPGIRLEKKLPAVPLYVVGDPTQLHRIMMNLCANAIHAMGKAGLLRVTLDDTEVADEHKLVHTALHPGLYARLAVEDSGTGMDQATLARIFEPFFTTKEAGKGTGLGLALVYGIVTDSGGAIDVESAVGRGSRFTIYLPRVESTPALDDKRELAIARGNGERVMVVDDERALVAVAAELLKRLGYEPLAFSDGRSALAAFEAQPERIDAVVADEVMPGLTGTELAQALRRRRPDMPIVLVSGFIGPMMTERALAAGVNEILKRPVRSRDVAAVLARLLKPDSLPRN